MRGVSSLEPRNSEAIYGAVQRDRYAKADPALVTRDNPLGFL